MSFSERGHFSLCQCRGPAGDCFPAGPKSTLSSTFYPPGLLRFQGEYRIGLGRFPTLHADRQDHDRQRNQPRQPEEPAMQPHLIRIVAEPPRSRGRGLLEPLPRAVVYFSFCRRIHSGFFHRPRLYRTAPSNACRYSARRSYPSSVKNQMKSIRRSPLVRYIRRQWV